MPYERAKVYFDGSHYIAIPNTSGMRKLKRKVNIGTHNEIENKESEKTTDKEVDLKQEFNRIYKENVLKRNAFKKKNAWKGYYRLWKVKRTLSNL